MRYIKTFNEVHEQDDLLSMKDTIEDIFIELTDYGFAPAVYHMPSDHSNPTFREDDITIYYSCAIKYRIKDLYIGDVNGSQYAPKDDRIDISDMISHLTGYAEECGYDTTLYYNGNLYTMDELISDFGGCVWIYSFSARLRKKNGKSTTFGAFESNLYESRITSDGKKIPIDVTEYINEVLYDMDDNFYPYTLEYWRPNIPGRSFGKWYTPLNTKGNEDKIESILVNFLSNDRLNYSINKDKYWQTLKSVLEHLISYIDGSGYKYYLLFKSGNAGNRAASITGERTGRIDSYFESLDDFINQTRKDNSNAISICINNNLD